MKQYLSATLPAVPLEATEVHDLAHNTREVVFFYGNRGGGLKKRTNSMCFPMHTYSF